jgi:hypothetical protein
MPLAGPLQRLGLLRLEEAARAIFPLDLFPHRRWHLSANHDAFLHRPMTYTRIKSGHMSGSRILHIALLSA